MTFSIIIPIYNASAYIIRSVQSILSQVYEDYEIILINDGSVDDSEKICLSLLDKYPDKINYYYKANGGAASARNFGVNNASGEFLLFLDSDDYWVGQDSLATIEKEILLCENIDLILLGAQTENSINGTVRTRVNFSEFEIDGFRNSDRLTNLSYLIESNKFPSSAWSVSVSRRFILENNISFKEGIVAEDIDWILECFYKDCKISGITDILYHYHEQRSGSVTNTAGEKTVKSLQWIAEKWYHKLLNDNSPKSKYLLQFLAFHYSTIFLALGKLTIEKRNKYLPQIKEFNGLLNFATGKKSKIVSKIIRFFGITYGSKILAAGYSIFLKIK